MYAFLQRMTMSVPEFEVPIGKSTDQGVWAEVALPELFSAAQLVTI